MIDKTYLSVFRQRPLLIVCVLPFVILAFGSIRQFYLMSAREHVAMADEIKSWKIEIVTSGGLSGKGDGGISAGSDSQVTASSRVRSCQDKLSPEELKAVEKLISQAKPGKWRKSYARQSNPHGYADQFLYQLKISIDRAGGSHTYETSWYDDSREKLPSDLDSLVNEVWKIRERVVAKC